MNAVVLSEEGIAHACIIHTEGQIPTLQSFHFSPIKNKAATKFALEKFIKANEIEKNSVVTSLPIAGSSLVMLERPDVEDEELAQAVRWNIKDSFPFNVDDAVVDVFEIPEQERGRVPLVYVTAAEKKYLKQRIKLLEDQGLNITSIDIAELVLRNIASLLPEDDQGVVLLKLDAWQGLMTLTQGSDLYLARNIDVGYDALLSPPTQNSEDGGLSEEQQHLLDTLVLEVQRSLDYYESHFAKRSINNLVIAPIGQAIPNVTKYLEDALGLKVRVFDFNAVLDLPDLISDEMQVKCFFAIGTALREFSLFLNEQKNGEVA